MDELNYTVKFTEAEFSFLYGNIYQYFRYMLHTTTNLLEDTSLSEYDQHYLKTSLREVENLMITIESINNRVPEPDQVFVFKEY
jgi:hypothetical protein